MFFFFPQKKDQLMGVLLEHLLINYFRTFYEKLKNISNKSITFSFFYKNFPKIVY